MVERSREWMQEELKVGKKKRKLKGKERKKGDFKKKRRKEKERKKKKAVILKIHLKTTWLDYLALTFDKVMKCP